MTREQLIDLLNRLEQKYPVEKWKVESMDIWPIVKTILFFEAYKSIENIGFQDKMLRVQRFFGREFSSIRNRIKSKINTDRQIVLADITEEHKINEIDLFFSSAVTYRSEYNNQSFSRYFDPLMDEAELLGKKALLFEYANYDNPNVYKEQRVINAAKKYKHFQSVFPKSTVDFSGLQQFNQLIREFPVSSFVLKWKIARAIKQTLIWEMLWTNQLQKTMPQIAMGICYYNWPMFGLKLACNKRSIPFIDMQHGGQGILHPSYTFNKKIAQLNLLPDYFWLWDKASADHLAQWIDNKDRIILNGNPWHGFLAEKAMDNNYPVEEKKVIVYTLQTGLSIPEFLLETIRTTPDHFIWYIRFHPRMTTSERKNINKKLNSSVAGGVVNLSDANTEPLPLLLSKALVHLSAYSGSITEAALKGVPVNITFDQIGKHSFANLIEEGKCLFFDKEGKLKLWNFIELELKGKPTAAALNDNIAHKNSTENLYEKILLNKVEHIHN
ncbi:MAG: hypothetical protein WC756_19615 [Taibaiella sp.]|jgi:hypothetical protein